MEDDQLPELPAEWWAHVFSYLSVKDLVFNVSLVSSRWHALANSGFLWQEICQRYDVPLPPQQDQEGERRGANDEPFHWKRVFKSYAQLEWDTVNIGQGVALHGRRAKLDCTDNAAVRTSRGFSSGIHSWRYLIVSPTVLVGVVSDGCEITNKSIHLMKAAIMLSPTGNLGGCHYFRERYSYRRQKIEAGDVVEVCLQFGCGPPKVTFFVNDMAVGNVEMQNVEGGSIFPAAELASSNAEVRLLNYKKLENYHDMRL